jgi:D-amino-acid oxidase
MSSRPAIVVLGAGIIGLTTALCLVQSPLGTTHIIHVLADHWPDDPVDPKYASGIAGAHHLSFADDDDKRQTKWDMRSECSVAYTLLIEAFQVMYNEWEDIGESTGLMALTQTEHYVGMDKHLKISESHPNVRAR